MTTDPTSRALLQTAFPPLTELTSAEAATMQASPLEDTESALIDLMFDHGAKKAFETASALAGQMQNSRFSWLTEINARALNGRPCIQPGFTHGPVSVHDAEYARLSMSLPYYGFVATTVEGHDLLLYSANDDNVARVYFYYGPDAYETLSMRIWQRLCQDAACIYDIGAFTGIYSLVARSANKACKCVAFEPMPHIRHRANMNIVLNGVTGSIDVEAYALSNSVQIVPFYTSVGLTIMDSGGSIASRGQGRAVSTDLVQAITLDEYLSEPGKQLPDLVKINVGFHEVAVLTGAQNLLQTARPSLIIEVSRTETLESVLSILHALDYHVFSIDDRKLRLYSHDMNIIHAHNGYEHLDDVHNIIACPHGKTAEMVRDLASH
jgi:FkbM family methyltransferase